MQSSTMLDHANNSTKNVLPSASHASRDMNTQAWGWLRGSFWPYCIASPPEFYLWYGMALEISPGFGPNFRPQQQKEKLHRRASLCEEQPMASAICERLVNTSWPEPAAVLKTTAYILGSQNLAHPKRSFYIYIYIYAQYI